MGDRADPADINIMTSCSNDVSTRLELKLTAPSFDYDWLS